MEPPPTPPPTPPPEAPSVTRRSRKPSKITMRALPQLSNTDNQIPVFARSSRVADKFLLKFQKNQLEKEMEHTHTQEIIEYGVDDNIVTKEQTQLHGQQENERVHAQTHSSIAKPLFTPEVRTIHVTEHFHNETLRPTNLRTEPINDETHIAVTPLSFNHGIKDGNIEKSDKFLLDSSKHRNVHSSPAMKTVTPISGAVKHRVDKSPSQSPKRIKVRLSTNGNVANSVNNNFNLSSMHNDMLNGFNEMESQMSGFRVITEQEFEIMTDIKSKYKKMLNFLQMNEKILNESDSIYKSKISEIEKHWSNMAKICQEQSSRLCRILTEEYETAKEEIATESQTIYNHLSKLYTDMKDLKENVSKPVKTMHELRERSSMTQRLSQINLGSLTEFIQKNELNNDGDNSDDKIRIIENMEFDIKVNWNQIQSAIKNPNNDIDVKNVFKVMDLNGNSIEMKNRSNKNRNKNNKNRQKQNKHSYKNSDVLATVNSDSLLASNEMSTSLHETNVSETDVIDKLSNKNSNENLEKLEQSNTIIARKHNIDSNNKDSKISNQATSNSSYIKKTENDISNKSQTQPKKSEKGKVGKLEAKDYHHTRASLSFDEELKEEFLKQWQNDDSTITHNTSGKDTSSIGESEMEVKMTMNTNNPKQNQNMIDSTLFCFTRDGDIHECRIQIDVSKDKFSLLAHKWDFTENEPEISYTDSNNVTAGSDDQSTEFFNSKLLHRTKYPAICLDKTSKKLYRFGGVLEGTQLVLAESFDTQTKVWNSNADNFENETEMIYQQLPVPRQEALALQLNSDNIIVCGGAAKLPKYSDLNEKSLILSGTRTSAQTEWHFYDICDEFHVSKNRWNSTTAAKNADIDSMYDSIISSMNEARYAFSGIVIPGEYKAIITGGNGPNGRTNTAEIYDRVSNTWNYINKMPNIKARHGSCWYDSMNTMIVVGGDSKSNGKQCFAYDMEKNQWFGDMPKLNKDHDRPIVKCYEDKSIVIVFGHNAKLNSFELLDGRIANSKWQITNVKNHPINVDFRAGMAVV